MQDELGQGRPQGIKLSLPLLWPVLLVCIADKLTLHCILFAKERAAGLTLWSPEKPVWSFFVREPDLAND